MTEEHEHFSEQVGPYARGELAPTEAQVFEGHLAACEECQAELKGARALAVVVAAADEPTQEPMNEMERARLHRGVLSATTGERPSVAGSSARRSLGSRIAPALGAAALFALFAFGATQLFTGMGGGDESADTAGGASIERSEGDLADGGPLGLPPASARSNSSAASGDTDLGDSSLEGTQDSSASGDGSGGEATEETTTQAFGAAFAQPFFEPGPRVISESALRRLGSQRDPFESFSFSYRAGDGTDRDALTTNLAMMSPEPAEVRTCADGVLDLDPNALPAYGALGTLDGEYVLALGFVTAPRGPLDNYEIWVWSFGNCTTPLTRVSGRI